MKNVKDVLLIVGNGFDINLGLKTKYKDFIDTINVPDGIDEIILTNEPKKEFVRINDSPVCNNRLIMELKNLHNEKDWVDIELELGNLARTNFKTLPQINIKKDFTLSIEHNELTKAEYVELKKQLKAYLVVEDIEFKDKFKSNWVNFKSTGISEYNFNVGGAYHTLRSILCRENIKLTILNFNYTNTIKTILNFFKEGNDVNMRILNNRDKVEELYVHGSINSDIVFGIDESEDIDDEYNYLLKSFDNITLNKNINRILDENDEIIFFGYSLGKTDESYFDDFFKKQCIHNTKEKSQQKMIQIYCYGDSGYHDIYSRLRHLTNKNFNKLNQNNNLIFTQADSFISSNNTKK